MSMSEDSYLEIFGISTSSRNFQILKSIIELTEKNGKAPEFSDIEERVNTNRDEPFSKQWIYKCLSDLEEQEMITIDRINKPTTYSTSEINLRGGLDKLRKQRQKALSTKYKELQEEMKDIGEQSIYDLAYYFVDTLSGKRMERRSGVIEGLDNIRRFVLLEVCEQSKSGDVIRANSRINFIDSQDEEIPLERMLLMTTQKGVKIKALLAHRSLDEAYEETNLRGLFREEQNLFREAITSESIDIRSPVENLMPYRIIALNNDKMFMFLADSATPDTVALIFREGNPSLVDAVIEKFDSIFENGNNLNDVVLSIVKE